MLAGEINKKINENEEKRIAEEAEYRFLASEIGQKIENNEIPTATRSAQKDFRELISKIEKNGILEREDKKKFEKLMRDNNLKTNNSDKINELRRQATRKYVR